MLRAPILAVNGTRPEAIRQVPVVHALARRGLAPAIVRTGQHPGLDFAAYGLGDYPAIELDCRPDSDPIAYAHRVAGAMQSHCADAELIVVQGDTSSALGGALAGFDADVPLAHVEAGLRSFDPLLPWPEEGNRVTIDARADLLFAPTATSAANLRAEGVRGAIYVTGNRHRRLPRSPAFRWRSFSPLQPCRAFSSHAIGVKIGGRRSCPSPGPCSTSPGFPASASTCFSTPTRRWPL